MKKESWNAVDIFFYYGIMPEYWKEIMVVLIPKVPNTLESFEFHPISLCQMVYKMSMGMIFSKLKPCTPSIIS